MAKNLHLEPGDLVAGRYRLERILGEGGMGVVWAATAVRSRQQVALKVLKAESREAVRRFLREARLAAAMRHPNVVTVHDIVELDDGTPVMVMDRLAGETLGERLAREDGGRLPLPEVARVLAPVMSALAAAHALGVVHRDLKPDNIFLSPSEHGGDDVRVLDFGIAKLAGYGILAAESGALTCTGSMLGTPYYMAPEQVFGQRDVDARADVWAVGVIAYEALSGRRPIEGRNLGQIFRQITAEGIVPIESIVPGLPADVTEIVGRMLARDRGSRPRDLREPLEVFARHLGPGSGRSRLVARATGRRGAAIGLAVIVGLAALAALCSAHRLEVPSRPASARVARWAARADVSAATPESDPPPGPAPPPPALAEPRRDAARPAAPEPAPPAPDAPGTADPATSLPARLPGGVHPSSPY